MLRLSLRVLILIAATVAITLLVWFVLLLLGVAFGSPLPECMDSDTCNWWGDFLYNEWGEVVCLLLGAVIAWRVATIRM